MLITQWLGRKENREGHFCHQGWGWRERFRERERERVRERERKRERGLERLRRSAAKGEVREDTMGKAGKQRELDNIKLQVSWDGHGRKPD